MEGEQDNLVSSGQKRRRERHLRPWHRHRGSTDCRPAKRGNRRRLMKRGDEVGQSGAGLQAATGWCAHSCCLFGALVGKRDAGRQQERGERGWRRRKSVASRLASTRAVASGLTRISRVAHRQRKSSLVVSRRQAAKLSQTQPLWCTASKAQNRPVATTPERVIPTPVPTLHLPQRNVRSREKAKGMRRWRFNPTCRPAVEVRWRKVNRERGWSGGRRARDGRGRR